MLADRNLPAAIEDLSGDQVPESIKGKSDQIREQGGIQSLEQDIHSLPELLQRNREILDEVLKISYICSLLTIFDLDSAHA